MALPALLRADEEITQYRLRAFEGTTPPDWVTPYNAAKSVLPPLVKVKRGGPDDAFQDFWYFNFDGTRRYVCTDTVPGNDLSGDFSVSAWIRLTSLSSNQTICSTMDATSRSGFRLYVRSGVVKGEAWFTEASSNRLVSVSASPPLSASSWYRITLLRRKDTNAGTHFFDLWINSGRVGRTALSMDSEIDNSTLDPVFGAERVDGGYGDYLKASVHAIQVDDYALSEFWLGSPNVRDGSRYFGLPSYHDYLGEGAGSQPLERRVMDTYTNIALGAFKSAMQERMILPFANDDYVPQGICGDQERGRLFVSFYYKDVDGNNPRNFSSIVAEINVASAQLQNVYVLKDRAGNPMTSHAGGILYEDGLLIVPDAKKLWVYDISDINPSNWNPGDLTGFDPVPIHPIQEIINGGNLQRPLVSWDSIAFVDLIRDEAHQPWLVLGDYNPSGPATNSLYRLRRFRDPSYISLGVSQLQLQLSAYTQGSAAYYFAKGVMKTFQAATGGNTSRILDVLYPANFSENTNAIQNSSPLIVPRGLEQLTFLDGKLWTLSESGSRYLQKRDNSPWPECFPFIYSLNVRARWDTNFNGIQDQWEAARNLPVSFDPYLDPDGDGLSTIEEYEADTDPVKASDVPRVSINKEGTLIFIRTSVLRFYTLQSSKDLRTWVDDRDYRHRRGIDGVQNFRITPTSNTFYRIRVNAL